MPKTDETVVNRFCCAKLQSGKGLPVFFVFYLYLLPFALGLLIDSELDSDSSLLIVMKEVKTVIVLESIIRYCINIASHVDTDRNEK